MYNNDYPVNSPIAKFDLVYDGKHFTITVIGLNEQDLDEKLGKVLVNFHRYLGNISWGLVKEVKDFRGRTLQMFEFIEASKQELDIDFPGVLAQFEYVEDCEEEEK
jgi:hypothetical protein